jgi:hypothetical protein
MTRTTRPVNSECHATWVEPRIPLAEPAKGEGTTEEEEPLVPVLLSPVGESVPLLPAPSLPKTGTLILNFRQTSWKRVVKTGIQQTSVSKSHQRVQRTADSQLESTGLSVEQE